MMGRIYMCTQDGLQAFTYMYEYDTNYVPRELVTCPIPL